MSFYPAMGKSVYNDSYSHLRIGLELWEDNIQSKSELQIWGISVRVGWPTRQSNCLPCANGFQSNFQGGVYIGVWGERPESHSLHSSRIYNHSNLYLIFSSVSKCSIYLPYFFLETLHFSTFTCKLAHLPFPEIFFFPQKVLLTLP